MNQQLTEWLTPLADWLAGLGVPEEQKMMAALGLLFLGATFVVLVLIVLLLRSRPAPPAKTPAEEKGVEETVEPAAAAGDEAVPAAEPEPEPEPQPEPEP
ncbi:MAG: hypothetical protein D6751_12630, partial [Deltaproteobacteria bacterium]